MEVVASLKPSSTESVSSSLTAPIWQDILAQAVTGEMIAVLNYTSLAGICTDPNEVAEALEHAEGESGHAAAFTAEGAETGHRSAEQCERKILEASSRRIPPPDRGARLHRLPHHSGGDARIFCGRQLSASWRGGAGQPGHHLCVDCRRGRRPYRPFDLDSPRGAGPQCSRSSTTRSTSCISK